MWYMQCVNVQGDSTQNRYTLRVLISQKSWEGFYEFDVRGVHIGFAKVQRVFINLTSIECVSISLKFKRSCKIDIHKVWELFCKIVIHELRVDFTKV